MRKRMKKGIERSLKGEGEQIRLVASEAIGSAMTNDDPQSRDNQENERK
jgi:hypothetical protein